jgi:hypothetical protein
MLQRCNELIKARFHTLKELFLQLSLCDLNLDSLVNLLVVATLVIGVVLDGGGEEGIDESSLSQTRFTSNLDDIRCV